MSEEDARRLAVGMRVLAILDEFLTTNADQAPSDIAVACLHLIGNAAHKQGLTKAEMLRWLQSHAPASYDFGSPVRLERTITQNLRRRRTPEPIN